MKNNPLSIEEFSQLMEEAGLHSGVPFCVAVSGGADSLALALLCLEWSSMGSYVTFDHGLREGSQKEANQVSEWLHPKGADHVILSWNGPKPKSDIQAKARDARYEAMEKYCLEKSIPSLLLGHHKDDQAETFFMRLLRGSGVTGLCAMEKISNPITLHNGPAIIRPFLDIPKERLKATLKEKVQQWIEDPSNENLGFLRIQVRKLLETTEIDGLNRDRLTSTAKRMQSVNKVLEGQVQKFLKENVIIFDEGYASLDPIPFRSLFEETGHKVLSILLQKMGGGKYPPRFEKIERLHKDLIQDDFIGATLAGCQIWAEGERLFFCRECNHIDDVKDIRAGSEILWDNRFVLNIKNVDQELVIKKLGQEGWQYCLDHLEGARNIDLPHSVRLSLPAFYNGEILIDVPHLKLTNSESNDVKMTLK